MYNTQSACMHLANVKPNLAHNLQTFLNRKYFTIISTTADSIAVN